GIAQQPQLRIPKSGNVKTHTAAGEAFTNIILNVHPDNSAPGSGWETPASVACIYKMVTQVTGCRISQASTLPVGKSGTIAIVDAYDYPTAANDLATFSSYFGLPAANFSVTYASGSKPTVDSTGGWELEEALDIEWAHAMNPQARIILVEASSNSN